MIQGYTRLYKPIQGYTSLYKAIQAYTRLYNPVQGYTILYKAIQAYTRLYKPIQGYTRLYKAIQAYTWLYKPIQGSSIVRGRLQTFSMYTLFDKTLISPFSRPLPHDLCYASPSSAAYLPINPPPPLSRHAHCLSPSFVTINKVKNRKFVVVIC